MGMKQELAAVEEINAILAAHDEPAVDRILGEVLNEQRPRLVAFAAKQQAAQKKAIKAAKAQRR